MKVLVVNGSPHPNGSCALALSYVIEELNKNGIETELLQVGNKDIRGCIACKYCKTHGKCVFNDIVNETAPKFEEADGLIVASPVYYAQANGTLTNFITRLFYSTPFDKTMKIGAGVVSARRAGTTATFDELNKFFSISSMPIVTSKYWNNIHGNDADEASLDLEARKVMRTLGKNAAFLIKAIQAEKEKTGLPKPEENVFTNFIR